MRKLLFTLLVAFLTLPTFARNFKYEYGGKTLTYTIISEEDKTCSLEDRCFNTGFDTEPGSPLVIPQEANDGIYSYTVTFIGDKAFYGCTDLAVVVIPFTVTSIGKSAFYGCTELFGVVIPNSVTSIGSSAFYNCNNLSEINIPNSVTSIGSSAFYKCGLTQITIPSSVSSIGESVFAYCPYLEEVSIPNSVTSIGSSAFSNCNSLREINIPNSVISIGERAFEECRWLTSVTIPNSVTSIGECAFEECLSLSKAEFSSIEALCAIKFENGSSNPLYHAHNLWVGGIEVKDLVIPTSVTTINDLAFAGCSSLTSVIIPNSVTSIGEGSFLDCSGLTSVTIPNSVTSIGRSAFMACRGLTSVTIGNSVTSIGYSAFWGCSNLTKAEFSSIEALCRIQFRSQDSNPLDYAHNLWVGGIEVKDLVIPESVTSINNYAFAGCSGLTSVTIPNSLTSFGQSPFINCRGLTSVYYLTDEPIKGDANIFYDSYENATLYMTKDGSVLARTIYPWKNFKKIEVYDQESGIQEIIADLDGNTPYEIYNLSGLKVGDSTDGIAPGIYIVRQGNKVNKIAVK